MHTSISYCIPCHKRIDDLLSCMNCIVAAANASPPIEIVIIDYGDQPPIAPLLEGYRAQLHPNNSLIIREYRHRAHYHMAHARNLTIRTATGEYLVIAATDIAPRVQFFHTIRELLSADSYTYLRSLTSGYIGVITVRRDELIAAGGFDERFEFYGSEDKELNARLNRRGARIGYYDLDALIELKRTAYEDKHKHYRMSWSRRKLWVHNKAICQDNEQRHVLVANEDIDWGSFAALT